MKKKVILSLMMITVLSLTACGSRSTSTSTSTSTQKGGNSNGSVLEGATYSDSAVNGIASDGFAYESDESMMYKSIGYDFNTEEYNSINENGFRDVALEPLSTFAADVDTGSYCNLRRMINEGYDIDEIPSGAVRVEEVLNYFDWDMNGADTQDDFSVKYEIADSPWNSNKILLATVEATSKSKTGDNNFVLLIDTSGSMDEYDKIDLASESFYKLVSTLSKNDKISVVTYAGSSETLLSGCSGSESKKISKAIAEAEKMCKQYGGGTNGSGGIEAAYKIASKNFIPGGNNRVIIASDGDMNLGVTSQSGLVDLIKEYKDEGIYLTTLGFGSGNYSDANMEQIADAGNGNYFYIDCIEEAERVLVDKMKQNTDVVAKDVKFQIEFNPAFIKAYRQVGYENRQMSASDFNDDKKDGGEVGAGQQVTIMYELVLGDGTQSNLRYQTRNVDNNSDELATIAIRYQNPNITGGKSKLLEFPIKDNPSVTSTDMYFAQGVAEAVMLIRDSEYKDASSFEDALGLIKAGTGKDQLREEFFDLMIEMTSDSYKPSSISDIGLDRDEYNWDDNEDNNEDEDEDDRRTVINDKILKLVVLNNESNIDILELLDSYKIDVLSSRKTKDEEYGKIIEYSIQVSEGSNLNRFFDELNDADIEYYTTSDSQEYESDNMTSEYKDIPEAMKITRSSNVKRFD